MSVWKEIRCDAFPTAEDCLSNLNHGPKGFDPTTTLKAQARQEGWKILSNGDAVCPRCAAHGAGIAQTPSQEDLD